MADGATLFTRDDTLFGVCEGLGEEFGFHPNYLRVALAASLLWNPLAVVGAYLAIGVALMLARWAMPAGGRTEQPTPQRTAQNDEAPLPLAEAA